MLFCLLQPSSLFKHSYIKHSRHLSLKTVDTSSFSSTYFQSTKIIKIKDKDGEIRNINYLDIGTNVSLPPLVIIPGTAQSITTYLQHIKQMSRSRRVIVPELRCQGLITDLSPHYATISQCSDDFKMFADSLNVSICDVIGFSFGGKLTCHFTHILFVVLHPYCVVLYAKLYDCYVYIYFRSCWFDSSRSISLAYTSPLPDRGTVSATPLRNRYFGRMETVTLPTRPPQMW